MVTGIENQRLSTIFFLENISAIGSPLILDEMYILSKTKKANRKAKIKTVRNIARFDELNPASPLLVHT